MIEMIKANNYKAREANKFTSDTIIANIKASQLKNETVVSLLRLCIAKGSYRVDTNGGAYFIDGKRVV